MVKFPIGFGFLYYSSKNPTIQRVPCTQDVVQHYTLLVYDTNTDIRSRERKEKIKSPGAYVKTSPPRATTS